MQPQPQPQRQPQPQPQLGLVFALLVSAAFFDGYDAQIAALLLPQIQDSFHASVTALGVAHIPIALGQFVAFFVARQADRSGRRPLLLLTVIGYTIFTAATALAWDLPSFAVLQFGAQVFIGAEFGVAVTMLVEVFPKERRGRALGGLLTFGPLGGVVVALFLAAGLQGTVLGWRLFYLVGVIPLLVVGVARRRLPETAMFEAQRHRRSAGSQPPREPLLGPWLPPYRGRLVLVGLVSLLQTLPTSAAVAWWAYYAERQRGLSTGQVATYVIFAYGAGLFGYYTCGRLMDRYGRRPTAIGYIVCTVFAGVGLFQSGTGFASPLLLAVAVFFGLGAGPVLSAFATELFPTHIRAQASSWIRNWFAVAGSALGPAMVGVLGDPYRGAIGNIGDTLTLLMLFALPAAFLVWRYMPETRGAALGTAEAAGATTELSSGPATSELAGGAATSEPAGGEPAGKAGVPATAAAVQYTRLRRNFVVGLSAVLLLLGATFAVVLTAGSGQQRPSGAAQDWLFDIAGSTASSGSQASIDQAAKLGPPALARALVAPGTRKEEAFTRIAVGRSSLVARTATVFFTVERPRGTRAPPVVGGVITLRKAPTGWHVVAVSGVHQVTTVPGPTSPELPGPWPAWAIGILATLVVVAATASCLVRRAGGLARGRVVL
ncbi:MAG TPA: MFS transporter [Acidimicrobiales bacterium]|nr:MFS transporter [Acidimicrobiales bacterium]